MERTSDRDDVQQGWMGATPSSTASALRWIVGRQTVREKVARLDSAGRLEERGGGYLGVRPRVVGDSHARSCQRRAAGVARDEHPLRG